MRVCLSIRLSLYLSVCLCLSTLLAHLYFTFIFTFTFTLSTTVMTCECDAFDLLVGDFYVSLTTYCARKRVHNGHERCEGVSNTITQLRLLGCVFLELHYWANRVKYVSPNISKIVQWFSLKLFVWTVWTSDFVLKQTKKGARAPLAPSKLGASATSTPRLRPRRVFLLFLCLSLGLLLSNFQSTKAF